MWPDLPITGFTRGRTATEADVRDGNAVFVWRCSLFWFAIATITMTVDAEPPKAVDAKAVQTKLKGDWREREAAKGKVPEQPTRFEDDQKRPVGYRLEPFTFGTR